MGSLTNRLQLDTANELLASLAWRKPIVFVLTDVRGLAYAEHREFSNRQPYHAVSADLWYYMAERLMLKKHERLSDYVDVHFVKGRRAYTVALPPDRISVMDAGVDPAEVPPLRTFTLEPRPL